MYASTGVLSYRVLDLPVPPRSSLFIVVSILLFQGVFSQDEKGENDENDEKDEDRRKGSAKGSGEHKHQLFCFCVPGVTIRPIVQRQDTLLASKTFAESLT